MNTYGIFNANGGMDVSGNLNFNNANGIFNTRGEMNTYGNVNVRNAINTYGIFNANGGMDISGNFNVRHGMDISGNLNVKNDLFIKGVKAINIIELSIESYQLSIVASKFIFDINLNNILGLSSAPIKTRVINLYAYNTIAPETPIIGAGITQNPSLPGTPAYVNYGSLLALNTNIYTGIYNIIYNSNINLQRITKLNESSANQVSFTSNTFNIKPASSPNPLDYNIIRYESNNNRPITIIFEILN